MNPEEIAKLITEDPDVFEDWDEADIGLVETMNPEDIAKLITEDPDTPDILDLVSQKLFELGYSHENRWGGLLIRPEQLNIEGVEDCEGLYIEDKGQANINMIMIDKNAPEAFGPGDFTPWWSGTFLKNIWRRPTGYFDYWYPLNLADPEEYEEFEEILKWSMEDWRGYWRLGQL